MLASFGTLSQNKGMQSLEAVQKFACKVCLKRWNLHYDSLLQLLNLSCFSVCRKNLKLTTLNNIVSGHMYFPSSIFVQYNLPYQFNCTNKFNFTRPFAHTNYMYHSFASSVSLSWNNLPDPVKLFSSISCFKRYICVVYIIFRNIYHINFSYTHVAFVIYDINFIKKRDGKNE